MNAERLAVPVSVSDKTQKEILRIARSGSPSEKRIAKYLSLNASELTGETAATLAERLKLSPMTVGRFLRGLGFHELNDLVDVIGNYTADKSVTGFSQPSWVEENSENPAMDIYLRQIQAIQTTFRLTTEPIWQETINTITNARKIFVTSGEQIFGSTLNFYTQIAEQLEGVNYMHASRAHLQLADTSPYESVLIILDANDASELLQRLANLAADARVHTIVVTTNPILWSSSHHLTVLSPNSNSTSTAFDAVQISALMELIVHAIKINVERPQHRGEKIARYKRGLGR